MAQVVIRYRIRDVRYWDTPEGRVAEEVWRPTCFNHAVMMTGVEELMDAVMGECHWCLRDNNIIRI